MADKETEAWLNLKTKKQARRQMFSAIETDCFLTKEEIESALSTALKTKKDRLKREIDEEIAAAWSAIDACDRW